MEYKTQLQSSIRDSVSLWRVKWLSKMGASSLDVLKCIIEHHRLQHHFFTLVRHKAKINWRQQYTTVKSRLEHLNSGLIFERPKVVSISGESFLDMDYKKLNTYRNDPNDVISIGSRVRNSDGGQTVHLALMNLHLDEPLSLEAIISAISSICRRKSWLLKTDRYFHVYGDFILDEEEWFRWNLEYLMTTTLVSPRYIGNSLERGYNTLRLNAVAEIKTLIPTVVAIVNDSLVDEGTHS